MKSNNSRFLEYDLACKSPVWLGAFSAGRLYIAYPIVVIVLRDESRIDALDERHGPLLDIDARDLAHQFSIGFVISGVDLTEANFDPEPLASMTSLPTVDETSTSA